MALFINLLYKEFIPLSRGHAILIMRRRALLRYRIFGAGTLGIPDNRPITIVVVENEEKIRRAMEEIQTIASEGLIVIVDAFIHPLHQKSE